MVHEGRRVMRSNDAVVAGVCAGLAEYFNVRPSYVRIIAVIILILGVGAPGLIYLSAAIMLPKRSADYSAPVDIAPQQSKQASGAFASRSVAAPLPPKAAIRQGDCAVPPIPRPQAVPQLPQVPGAAYAASDGRAYDVSGSKKGWSTLEWALILLGIEILGIGAGFLLRRFVPGLSLLTFMPLPLLFLGFYMLFKDKSEQKLENGRLMGGLIVIIALLLLLVGAGMFNPGGLRALDGIGPFLIIAFGMNMLGRGSEHEELRVAALLLLIVGLLFCLINNGTAPNPGNFMDPMRY